MRLDIGLLVLRLGFGGLLFFSHGWGKLLNFNAVAVGFPDPLGVGHKFSLGLAIFAEVFCALCIMLGVATRLVAIPIIITMLVIAFVVHFGDTWHKKEFALLFAIPMVTLILTGPGSLSLDWITRKRR